LIPDGVCVGWSHDSVVVIAAVQMRRPTRRSTLSMLQPAMLGLPTSAAEPSTTDTSGCDRAEGAAVGVGGRDSIGRSAETRGAAMLTEFCVAFSTVCFTLLGLWIIVVQTRHGEWRHSAIHRRRAYGVALHFSLPGLMSLLSLVDPASTALWRICFAIVAAGGGLARHGRRSRGAGAAAAGGGGAAHHPGVPRGKRGLAAAV
jgi:hypothetical protein